MYKTLMELKQTKNRGKAHHKWFLDTGIPDKAAVALLT